MTLLLCENTHLRESEGATSTDKVSVSAARAAAESLIFLSHQQIQPILKVK